MNTSAPASVASSFSAGVRAFFRGVKFVVGTPSLWLAAAAPVVAWLVVFGVISAASARYVMRSLHDNMTITETLERVASAMAGFVAAFLAATALAQPLAGPALDTLVERRRAQLGLAAGIKEPLRATMPRALGVTLLGLAVSLPILGGLWLLAIAVPLIAPALLVLKFLVVALAVAWDFLDYPFAAEGMRLGERVAFIRANFGLVMGFGIAAALVLLVPCVGLMVLPIGVAGATDALFFGRGDVSRYPRSL